MLAAPELDVAEVLRETSASAAAVGAVVMGTVAAAALVVGVVLTARERRHATGALPDRAVVAALGVVAGLTGLATVAELTLLLLDGTAVTDRRPLVAVARLLVLAAAVALHRLPADDPTATRLPAGLAVAALATVVLGAPALGGATDMTVALAVTLTATLVAAVVLATIGARLAPLPTVMTAIVLLAVPAAWALVPDRVPPHHEERIVVGDVVLDTTVAPLRPGANEIHLYAWDEAGTPLALDSSTVALHGRAETGHELFVVSPNHHLSYDLELPPAEAWQLMLTARVADGTVVDASLDLKAP